MLRGCVRVLGFCSRLRVQLRRAALWRAGGALDHPPDIDDQVESGRRLARLLELPRELVDLRLIRRVLL